MKQILITIISLCLIFFLLLGIIALVHYIDIQVKYDKEKRLNNLKTLTISEKLDKIIIHLERLH